MFFLILLPKPMFEAQSLMVEVVCPKFEVIDLKLGVRKLKFGLGRLIFEARNLKDGPNQSPQLAFTRNSPLKYHYELKFLS